MSKQRPTLGVSHFFLLIWYDGTSRYPPNHPNIVLDHYSPAALLSGSCVCQWAKRVTRFIERTKLSRLRVNRKLFCLLSLQHEPLAEETVTDPIFQTKSSCSDLGYFLDYNRLASDHCCAIKRTCDVTMHLFSKKRKKKKKEKKKEKKITKKKNNLTQPHRPTQIAVRSFPGATLHIRSRHIISHILLYIESRTPVKNYVN